MSEKTIAIGCDHAALEAKERLKEWLEAHGYEVKDFGVNAPDSVDYPDIARPLSEAVAGGEPERGVLLCGTGLGMSYVANRVPGIRAALCYSEEAADLARSHNDANVLVLPGRAGTMDPLEKILAAWVNTPFSGDERHRRRIDKIEGR